MEFVSQEYGSGTPRLLVLNRGTATGSHTGWKTFTPKYFSSALLDKLFMCGPLSPQVKVLSAGKIKLPLITNLTNMCFLVFIFGEIGGLESKATIH